MLFLPKGNRGLNKRRGWPKAPQQGCGISGLEARLPDSWLSAPALPMPLPRDTPFLGGPASNSSPEKPAPEHICRWALAEAKALGQGGVTQELGGAWAGALSVAAHSCRRTHSPVVLMGMMV